MDYKYGVSYNCNVCGSDGWSEVGGGGEGSTTLNALGNDLDKVIKSCCEDGKYITKDDHEYIGHDSDVGGEIVAVIGEYEYDEFSVVCIVFEDPVTPTIIK